MVRFNMVIFPYNKNLKPFSRDLRNNMTMAEVKLWQRIRRKQILDVQFFRQRPLGQFILDFYAKDPKIAIELDGSQHYLLDQKQKDIERDYYLKSLNIKVLRFDNNVILKNCDHALDIIYHTILSLRNSPL